MANPPGFEDLQTVLKQHYAVPNGEFLALLKQLFSGGLESDAAFHELMARADDFFDELLIVLKPITEEVASREDNSYSWYHHALLDCISCAHRSQALTVLWQELRNSNDQARSVVISSLTNLGKTSSNAKKILREAHTITFRTAEETQRFQDKVRSALKNVNKPNRL